MTDSEAINRAIDVAIVGTDADRSVISRQKLELQSLYENAINMFADKITNDPNSRHLLMQSASLDLLNDPTTNNQYAVLPTGAMSAAHKSFSLVDAAGNILCNIQHRNDFLSPQAPVFGYYWLEYGAANEIRIFVRATGSSIPDFFGTQGPLTADYLFIPQRADQIPGEIENDFIAIFASLIKTGIENHTLIP